MEYVSENTERAARTYGAAADHYELPTLSFWDRFGEQTVERLRLEPGMAVLDLCCGAGASAIPAARAVGTTGRVLGIDVAEPLLRLARAKAAKAGLANLEFRCGDATRTGLADSSFDAVTCVFGVFFAADMAAFAAEMWRLVGRAGTLAVTTWGDGLFEPANSCFWDAVGEVEPALVRAFNPWDEITSEPALADLFARAGMARPAVTVFGAEHHLEDPDQFWDIVLGSGYRATIDALSADQQEQVRARLLPKLRSARITALRTDVIFATAQRPT
jgi:ubiquinone/menaquinone biosynthesis C-methylase UbiE